MAGVSHQHHYLALHNLLAQKHLIINSQPGIKIICMRKKTSSSSSYLSSFPNKKPPPIDNDEDVNDAARIKQSQKRKIKFVIEIFGGLFSITKGELFLNTQPT